MKIKIIIADDHKIVRDGITSLLEREKDIEVIGSVDNGRAAYNLAKECKPDVVIMDIFMEGLNGILATKQITTDMPGSKILILSMFSEKKYVHEAFQAGAMGYLLKDCAYEELAKAIRALYKNQNYLSQKITNLMVENFVHKGVDLASSACAELSIREKEVLQLIAEGVSTKDIAKSLHVSIKTVESHRKKIMDKLDIHTVAGLTKYALREGLVSE